MKTFYIVLKEKAGDEAHEHDLVEVFRSESLEEAEKKLVWDDNLYGRIDKIYSEYTPPPAGKQWKSEKLGWSDEFVETIKEN